MELTRVCHKYIYMCAKEQETRKSTKCRQSPSKRRIQLSARPRTSSDLERPERLRIRRIRLLKRKSRRRFKSPSRFSISVISLLLSHNSSRRGQPSNPSILFNAYRISRIRPHAINKSIKEVQRKAGLLYFFLSHSNDSKTGASSQAKT